jgi:hypothetical protein
MLDGQERAGEVDVEHLLPQLDVRVDHPLHRADPRVGESDVQAPEALDRQCGECLDVGLHRHVGALDGDRLAQLAGQRAELVLVEVTHHHPGALGHEAPGCGPTDARRAPGDQGDLACQSAHGVTVKWLARGLSCESGVRHDLEDRP